MQNKLLKIYLQKISYDLLTHIYEDQNTKIISKYTFSKFTSLPISISNRLYLILSKDQDYLTQDLFISGMSKILVSNSTEKKKTLYELLDSNREGKLKKKDVFVFYRMLYAGKCYYEIFIEEKLFKNLDNLSEKDFYLLADDKFIEKIYGKILKGISSQDRSIEYFTTKYSFNKSNTDLINIYNFSEKLNQELDGQIDDDDSLLSALTDVSVNIIIPSLHVKTKFFVNESKTDFVRSPKKMIMGTTNVIENNFKNKIISNKFCDIEIDCEGYVYKLKKDNSLKKYWLALIGKDLFYFKSQIKERFRGIHNLCCSYITEIESLEIDGVLLYKFNLVLNKERQFVCKTKDEATKWVNKLKAAIGQRDILDDYILLNLIGEGAFGTVRLASHKQSNNSYAIKIIDKSKLTNCELERVNLEIDILKLCNHENIVALIDNYEDRYNIYIVMEYLEYDLTNYLQYGKMILNENRIRYIFKQIGEGLKYLHSNGIIHRDIKLDNIMLNETNNGVCIKITDFGLSDIIGTNTNKVLCGTILYLAPEMILMENYNHSVDVWSLGVLLYYFLFNNVPFIAKEENQILKNILGKEIDIPKRSGYSNNVLDLLMRCLQKNPKDRITIDELLYHPWIKN